VIPPVYLDWYRALFEQGKRLPPPDNAHALGIVTTVRANESVESGSFVINKTHEFDSEIIWHDGVITVTQSSVYFDGKNYPKPPFDVKLVVSPRQRHLIAAFHDGTRLRFRDLTVDKDVASEVEGEDAMLSSGKLYIKQHESIFAVDLVVRIFLHRRRRRFYAARRSEARTSGPFLPFSRSFHILAPMLRIGKPNEVIHINPILKNC